MFWEDIRDIFINSLRQIKTKVILSISQRQVVIKLLEKKEQDNQFTKNCKPKIRYHLLFVQIKLRM